MNNPTPFADRPSIRLYTLFDGLWKIKIQSRCSEQVCLFHSLSFLLSTDLILTIPAVVWENTCFPSVEKKSYLTHPNSNPNTNPNPNSNPNPNPNPSFL